MGAIDSAIRWFPTRFHRVVSRLESWAAQRIEGDDIERWPRPYYERARQLTHSEGYLGETEALSDATEEARKTIDHQIQSLDDMDSKAARILRLNVLVLGLLLTALSIAPRAEEVSLSQLNSDLLLLGVGFLFASTAFAALTYTASEFYPGVEADDLDLVIDEDFTRREFNIVLANSYADWIEFNDETNIRNAPLSTATTLCLLAGMAYIGLGLYDSLLDPISPYQEWSVHLLLLTLTTWAGLPVQVYRWWKISLWARVLDSSRE